MEIDSRQLELIASGVRIIALRMLGDADAAADVAQETVSRTIAAVRDGKIDDPDKLPAFARSVARHVATDALRVRAKTVPTTESDLNAAPSDAPDPLAQLLSREDRSRLAAALATLAADDRDLLRLCYVEGLTPSEIAERVGAPAPRVRKRKSRALDRLRQAFVDTDAESRPATSPDIGLGIPPTLAPSRGRAR